jgi:hypothetical protein
MKKLILLTFLVISACARLFAQDTEQKKLNSIQTGSVFAPSPVRIDGKLNEWNNDFKAYNRNTRILYILSNDEKNMYLVAKSIDFTTKAKIIAGGIDLIINADGKKEDKDAPSVTFPVIDHPERLGGNNDRFQGRNAGADTAMMHKVYQHTIIAAKHIKVLGIKSVTDTLISIYNTDGIKAAINFDDDGSMTLEMAIPLKLMNLTANDTRQLAYHIVLNGYQVPGMSGDVPAGDSSSGPNTLNFRDLVTPSDFWGKYTLAKK